MDEVFRLSRLAVRSRGADSFDFTLVENEVRSGWPMMSTPHIFPTIPPSINVDFLLPRNYLVLCRT